MRIVVLEGKNTKTNKKVKLTSDVIKKQVSAVCAKLKKDEGQLENVISEINEFFKGMKIFFDADYALQKIHKDKENSEEEEKKIEEVLPDDGLQFQSLLQYTVMDNKKVPDSVKLAVQVNFLK